MHDVYKPTHCFVGYVLGIDLITGVLEDHLSHSSPLFKGIVSGVYLSIPVVGFIRVNQYNG